MGQLSTLIRRDGTVVGADALDGCVVTLFFSAEDCPACRSFLPLLKTLHETAKEEDVPLQVIYVSSDRDAEQHARCFRTHGEWLSLPFVNWEARAALKERYGVWAQSESGSFPNLERRAGIPSLVVIAPDGDERVLLDCEAPTEIRRKGAAILDEWVIHRWPEMID